jgi:hypothetical protein
MKTTKMEMYGVILAIAGMLLASVFNPEDIRASILSGIDEPTGNAYDDLFVAEEENATFPSESNQTANENNTDMQK